MIHDAHFHMTDDLYEQLVKENIYGIVSIDSKEEYLKVKPYIDKYQNIIMSVGIHPWKADTVSFTSILPYLDTVSLVGEIGLDNVWCNTDMDRQKEAFIKQLAYASNQRKNVILHTKGMEKEIYETIKQYPNTYLVHWYSCKEYLQEYIDMGCYFTIGPSVGNDETVDAVASKAPIDRILIESDGLSAIEWAVDRKIEASEYKCILERSIKEIARLRNTSYEIIENALMNNYKEFTKRR